MTKKKAHRQAYHQPTHRVDLHRPPPASRPEMPLPAPKLMHDNRCSDCNVRSILIAGGDLRVCPVCFALLWHDDWSAEERRKRAEAAAAAAQIKAQLALRRKEIFESKNRRVFFPDDLVVSSPAIGTPKLGIKGDDDEGNA